MTANLKPRPDLLSDAAAEAFVPAADLTDDDRSGIMPMRFEFSNKDARVNMRLPAELLEAVKARAARQGIPYQQFIRQALEQALWGPTSRRAA